MDPMSRFIFLLPLILSLNQVFATGGVNLISKACEQSLYKDFCVKSLQSHPESHHADLPGLATIAINLAVANATEISVQIQGFLNVTTDPFIQQCLSDCSESYMDAVDQLEDSIAALDSKGYSDVSTWVQAAMSDAESCEDGFKDQPDQTPLLSDRNTIFSKLCGNALAITNILAGF